jgi:hypothetical protein
VRISPKWRRAAEIYRLFVDPQQSDITSVRDPQANFSSSRTGEGTVSERNGYAAGKKAGCHQWRIAQRTIDAYKLDSSARAASPVVKKPGRRFSPPRWVANSTTCVRTARTRCFAGESSARRRLHVLIRVVSIEPL